MTFYTCVFIGKNLTNANIIVRVTMTAPCKKTKIAVTGRVLSDFYYKTL